MANSELTDKVKLDATIAKLPDGQREKLAKVASEILARQNGPSMKLKLNGEALTIRLEHDDLAIATLLQMIDLGTRDADFHSGLTSQIACLGSDGRSIDSENSNFVMSVVRSIEPQNELEAMLATQMGATHAATMMMARKLNLANNIQQRDSAERAYNKLARTFTSQVETLRKLRNGGNQTVTVQHVNVSEGGQAIVGNVKTGGRG